MCCNQSFPCTSSCQNDPLGTNGFGRQKSAVKGYEARQSPTRQRVITTRRAAGGTEDPARLRSLGARRGRVRPRVPRITRSRLSRTPPLTASSAPHRPLPVRHRFHDGEMDDSGCSFHLPHHSHLCCKSQDNGRNSGLWNFGRLCKRSARVRLSDTAQNTKLENECHTEDDFNRIDRSSVSSCLWM